MSILFQELKKWRSGGPLTIYEKFSNIQIAGRLGCSLHFYQPKCINPKLLQHLWMEAKVENVSKCFFMSLDNLAEPRWVSLSCHQQMKFHLICIKDKKAKHAIHISKESLINKYFCALNAILVDGMCYAFHWISDIDDTRCVREIFKLNIMSFKHIYEAIALENTILSAFIVKNISTMIAVAFVRYFDTVIFEQSFVSISEKGGYIICPSRKYFVLTGSHIFKCSNGSSILYKYVCDGTIDCPNDKSDEVYCVCNDTRKSKWCKTVYHSKYLIICSATYYMTRYGECLKYTSPDKLYKEFNINYDTSKYRMMRTSKLVTINHSTATNQQEGNNGRNLLSPLKLNKYFGCLHPGEVPCWEGYSRCFNIASTCIYQISFNNILLPCENGRHLHYCKKFSCDTMFKCWDNYCVPWSYICDGKWDCPKGDDELDTLVSNQNTTCIQMYHCRNTAQTCLHLGNTCDGHNDCPFGDDELLCEFKSVECPSFCVCLLYAIKCTDLSDENIEQIYQFDYLSVHFSNFKLSSIRALIIKLQNAIVLTLQRNDIRAICDSFNKVGELKCILLDLSFNFLKSVEKKCFSTTRFLTSLIINNNNINSIAKYSFHSLFNLKFLSLKNNPLHYLPDAFLISTSNLKTLSIDNVNFQYINPEVFHESNINFIITTDYHICCTAPSSTFCTAFRPWYISCSDILPSLSMKIFYILISIFIIILNFLSLILHVITYRSHKTFVVIVFCINVGDILCGIYLSLIWIASISFSGSFHVKEESWKSGFLCLTAFATILFFIVLSEFLLTFLSLARLLLVLHPLNTRFKEKEFIVKSLAFLVVCSLFFSVCITLIFKITGKKSTISICLPFIDPTGSQLMIKLITWFVVISQLATSIVIMIMHFYLLKELRKSQQNVQKSKSKEHFNVSLIIQLITITMSNILCWFPAGCVYLIDFFLSRYPMDLVIWTTVIGLPINSVLNPIIFIVTTIKKIIKFSPTKNKEDHICLHEDGYESNTGTGLNFLQDKTADY